MNQRQKFTSELPIPKEVLEQHIAILGKTRSGKSSKARVLVEWLLFHGKPVCIIDPKGDWWGLKLAANGQGAGYPLVIFGGTHADIPITERAGKAVAEIVATGNRPCLIDLGGWTVGARTRFFIDFAETLFILTKGNRHLVIDEVHNFCPKGKIFSPDAGMMLHWANRLATEGQGKGIRLIAASQRPQKVHNDFLTSCETLIACRTNHPADRVAFKEWMEGCADPKVGKEVLDTLASMQRAEAWTWSPEINYGPIRIEWPKFATYDSFKPQEQDAAPLTGWAAVDIEEVKARLTLIVEEVEANNPPSLKKKIAELEQQKRDDDKTMKRLERVIEGNRIRIDELMNAKPEQKPEVDQKAIKKAEPDPGTLIALNKIFRLAEDALKKHQPIKFGPVGEEYPVKCAKDFTDAINEATPRRKIKPVQVKVKATDDQRYTAIALDVTKPQQKILNALAWYEAAGIAGPYTRIQIGFVSGYRHTSGGFKNMLGNLRTAGLLSYPKDNYVALTEEGRKMAEHPETMLTTETLQQFVKDQLTGPHWKVLHPIINAYPKAVDRITVAEYSGYSVTSGGFKNLLGNLRSYGLIEYPADGMLIALPVLFIE